VFLSFKNTSAPSIFVQTIKIDVMENHMANKYFQTGGVKLDIAVPDLADVAAGDYTAKLYTKGGAENGDNAAQQPFYICHPVALTMKVETWLGKTLSTWTFDANKDATPLKKIFSSPTPVDADGTEVTSIQVGY
jgi:hypothetical protein